jgi:two-component system OmpR family sensor kinase
VRLPRSSLSVRLLTWFCLANLLVLLLGGLLTRGFIDYSTAVEINWDTLAQAASRAYDSGGSPALAAWSAQQRHDDGIAASLYENGAALAPIHLPPPIERWLPGWLEGGRDLLLQPRPGLYLAVRQVIGADGHARQLVALSRSHTRLRPQTRQRILLAVQLLLSLLCIGLLGWWVARSVARPIEALREATRRMAGGELSTRVGRKPGPTRDELALLAYDFDAMAERIEALVAHDRAVLQDLSHELRSPLARLQLLLTLAQRSADAAESAPYFLQAEQEIARLDRMTGEMLALSRLEGGIPGMQREPLDLVALLGDCQQRAALPASEHRITLPPLAAMEPIIVFGSPLLLERALDNLIANAIKFSAPGGSVELAVAVVEAGAEVVVRDHGPGVPEAELGSLFRPFFRGSNAVRADGHGIGLAIVQRVVEVHGGTINACNPVGGGLQVQLRLPLAQR